MKKHFAWITSRTARASVSCPLSNHCSGDRPSCRFGTSGVVFYFSTAKKMKPFSWQRFLEEEKLTAAPESLFTKEVSAPSTHTPSVHAPFTHTPSVHAPFTQTPCAHTPSVYTPCAHTPSVHGPFAHTPSVHTPFAHTPSVHTPFAHTPCAHALPLLSVQTIFGIPFHSHQRRS